MDATGQHSLPNVEAPVRFPYREPRMTAPEGPTRSENSLVLYVAGASRRALGAMTELRRFVEEHRDEAWQLDVVDVLQPGKKDSAAEVLMTPTLVARTGGVERRIIGRFDELALALGTRGEGRKA